MKSDIFLIDFDITISKNDSTDVLLEIHNKQKKQEILELYRNGKLTIREYIKYGLESLDLTKEEYINTLKNNVKIDDTFQYFLDNKFNYRIVSAGSNLNVLASLLGNGIEIKEDMIISNNLVFDNDKITVVNTYLDDNSYYGVDKGAIVKEFQNNGSRVIYLGDGSSDYEAAKVADYVFARSGTRLVNFCNNNNIEFLEFENFIEVVEKYKNKIRLGESKCWVKKM